MRSTSGLRPGTYKYAPVIFLIQNLAENHTVSELPVINIVINEQKALSSKESKEAAKAFGKIYLRKLR